MGWAAGITHGCGDGFLFAVWGSENNMANMVEGGQGDDFGGLLIGTGENQREFFASVPGSEAFLADSFLKGFSNSNQNFITGIVTISFIEESKVIYVHHDNSDSGAVASNFIALFSEEVL